MDEQAGKGGDFGSQRLDFQLLGGLQTLLESLKEHVIISIQKGDRADEGNSYRVLLTFHWVTSEKPLSIMKTT